MLGDEVLVEFFFYCGGPALCVRDYTRLLDAGGPAPSSETYIYQPRKIGPALWGGGGFDSLSSKTTLSDKQAGVLASNLGEFFFFLFFLTLCDSELLAKIGNLPIE